MRLELDDFDTLETDANGSLCASQAGCGCCSTTDWELDGREIDFIKRHIDNLRSQISRWENELSRYADQTL